MREVEIYLSKFEVGWAVPLGGDLARIANIPTSGLFNIDDVVKVGRMKRRYPGDPGLLAAKKVVKRRYDNRLGITYEKKSQFFELADFVRRLGGKIEGLRVPSREKRGIALIAVNSPFDKRIEKFAEQKLGIEDPVDYGISLWLPAP